MKAEPSEPINLADEQAKELQEHCGKLRVTIDFDDMVQIKESMLASIEYLQDTCNEAGRDQSRKGKLLHKAMSEDLAKMRNSHRILIEAGV